MTSLIHYSARYSSTGNFICDLRSGTINPWQHIHLNQSPSERLRSHSCREPKASRCILTQFYTYIMEKKLPTREDGLHRATGYPELAFLISTDMDFSIYRKFDELSARNLLRMQAELITIEDELRSMDNTHSGHIMDVARKESLFSRSEILLEKYRNSSYIAPGSHNALTIFTRESSPPSKPDPRTRHA